jgi:MFS family permease
MAATREQPAAERFRMNSTMRALMAMVILVGMGEHMAERFLPLYLDHLSPASVSRLSIGVLSIGALAFLDDFLSALYSFPGGYLSDRLGAKRALFFFNLLSMAGYAVVIFVPRWWAVLLGAALFISWSAISLPATMELIAKAVPKSRRTMGVSVQALVRRIPKTLGPFVGGACIGLFGVAVGIRIAFAAAIALAVLAILLQQRYIEGGPPAEAERNPFRLYRRMSPSLRNLMVSDILIRFCERIPDAFVVLWVTRGLAATAGAATETAAFQFGILSVIENVTAVLVYIPVAHFADRFGKKPFVLATFGFFALFPLALSFSRTFPILAAAFVLRGLKEFGEPTRKALIMDLAPEGRKAAMFGLYYLIRDVVVSFAALAGAFLWAVSPRVNLAVAFGFGVAGTAWFAVFGRDVDRAEAAAPAAQTGPGRRTG